MDLLIISTRFIHTDHLEFPRMYRAWRVNSFQGHETRSKTMHHVKSVTELRIAPTLAAFNWVTRYNLSCSCFNPVFNFSLLSLTLSSFPQILCVTVSLSLFTVLRWIPRDYLARNCYSCRFAKNEVTTCRISSPGRLKREREGNLFFLFFSP